MKKKKYFEPEINICRLIFAQEQLFTASEGDPEDKFDEDVDSDD